MQAFFRLDCGPKVGMGHAVRCSAIADALAENQVDCSFALKASFVPFSRGLFNSKHELVEVPDNEELHVLFTNTDKSPPALLVVDHYGSGRENLSAKCFDLSLKVLIDDFDTSNSACDIFINPNISAKSWKSQESKTLLGPRFAPIREKIALYAAKWHKRDKNDEPLECLISIGATDPLNFVEKILDVLVGLPQRQNFRFSVVLTSAAPYLNQVLQHCQILSALLEVEVIVDPPSMGALYARAFCCIGAAGSSAWERCCVGLPTAQLVVADNQMLIQDELNKAGAIAPLNRPDETGFAKQLREFLIAAKACDESFLLLSMNARKLVDGRGAQRIAQALIKEMKH